MHILTYLISFIALGVLARAIFVGNNADEQRVSVDTMAVLLAEADETKIPDQLRNDRQDNNAQDSSPLKSGQATPGATTNNPPLIINEKPEASSQQLVANIPNTINHPVTFFSQAPDGNRNLPRQEACEEASIILANYFIKGKSLTKDQMRADILALVDRQMELFGDYLHTTVEQTQQLYEDFYGGESYIIDNPSIDQIKSILAQGHMIVAPFAGRKLGNPYYSGKGPVYHMMLLRGYDDTSIYTNDVGTSRGENYRYSYQTILDANHDRAADINQGAKRMLVITE